MISRLKLVIPAFAFVALLGTAACDDGGGAGSNPSAPPSQGMSPGGGGAGGGGAGGSGGAGSGG